MLIIKKVIMFLLIEFASSYSYLLLVQIRITLSVLELGDSLSSVNHAAPNYCEKEVVDQLSVMCHWDHPETIKVDFYINKTRDFS